MRCDVAYLCILLYYKTYIDGNRDNGDGLSNPIYNFYYGIENLTL